MYDFVVDLSFFIIRVEGILSSGFLFPTGCGICKSFLSPPLAPDPSLPSTSSIHLSHEIINTAYNVSVRA